MNGVNFLAFTLLFSTVVQTESLVKEGDRVWMIGDSNACLLMHELPRITKRNGVVFGGNPVAGSSIIQWDLELRNEYRELRRFNPDVVLVALGSNDAYFESHVIANEPPYLYRLLSRLRRKQTKVVWIGPPKLEYAKEGLLKIYNMLIPEVIVLDSRQIDIEMWDDKLHPSEAGRASWARWIWRKLTATPDFDKNTIPLQDGC